MTVAPIIEEFRVSPYAERHMLEKHGVDLEDAVSAAESTPRQTRTYSAESGENRYVIPGRTETGRRLWVIFADDEGGGTGRIITAYDPLSKRDAARHKQMRGD